MTAAVACFTSFTYGYLPRALILCRTLRAAHPDWPLWALIVDRPPPGQEEPAALAEFDGVVHADELGIDNFEAWMFRHDLIEACTALKGAMLLRLLRGGAGKVLYLDPDIAVFHGLQDTAARLDSASVVLTPHQLAPNDTAQAVADNEHASLRYGIYNLGFLAVRGDPNGLAFATWWADQLYEACYDLTDQGIFTDQRWCDLVPALFEGVHIDRDPGSNVASWNLSRRTIAFDQHGRALVNGSPLKFYHFTKIPGVGEVMTERYAGEACEPHELMIWYKRTLAAIDVGGCEQWPWHYAAFDTGEPVRHAARLLLRARPDLVAAFPFAFRSEGDSLHAWFRREQPELLAPRVPAPEPVAPAPLSQ